MKLSTSGDSEINAITLVATHTTIPVPPLLRVIHTVERHPEWRYIIIRFIPGPNLEDCWLILSWWRKANILWTLRRYVRQLRRIPLGNRPPGPIGDGPQVCDGAAFTEVYVCIGLLPCAGLMGANDIDQPRQGSGPFATYAEMSAWFAHKLVVSQRLKRARQNVAPFDSSLPLVFTHFDLSPRNLMLDEKNRLWVIDFQLSGNYPQWFEYAGMLPTWDRFKYHRWITAFVAGNYRKQRIFLVNVDWAVNVGHLVR